MHSLLESLNRFLGLARARRKERALSSTEAEMQARVAGLFRRQGIALVKRMNKARDKWAIQEAGPQAPFPGWEELFDDMADATEQEWLIVLRRYISLGLLSGAQEAGQIGATFSLKNPRAEAYMAEHGAKLITRISETTRDSIKALLDQGMESGWSYDTLAGEIINRFEEFAVGRPQMHIDSRAHLVAVTEMGQAYEAGNYIPIQEMQDAGLEMEKAWLTVGDERVSDGCQENQDDGWIPADELHSSGHLHPLRFPGCRCSELYRRKGSGA